MAKGSSVNVTNSFSVVNFVIFRFIWIFIISIPFLFILFFKKIFPGKGKILNGKNILITGTARGLGKALALEFATQGCKVICVDINKSANEKTVQEINKALDNSESAISIACDVADLEAVKKLSQEIYKKFDKIDILVNNAGIVYAKSIQHEDETMVKKVINVNLLSCYWLVQTFLPQMKRQNEGHIVFINSISSLTALGDATIYTSSKYGLLGLADALLDEFSRDKSCSNIKISSAHPFFIETEGLTNENVAPKNLMINAYTAAKIIVRGVRREYIKFTVPGYETGFYILSLSGFLPVQVYQKLINSIYQKVMK